jgi:hypothetical protein
MKESGIVMLFHAVVITLVLYLLMITIGQSSDMAQDRALVIGAVILIYMLMFGHQLPHHMNSNLRLF